jgi:hypothetical protein
VIAMSDKKFLKRLNKIKKRGEQYKAEKALRDEYEAYAPAKKKKKVSNIMLVIVMIAIISYAIADFVLQYYTSIEVSSTLTTCWFTFWGAEIFALAGIKISKVKNGTNE